MPICNECLTPCNCLVDEDGFRSGRGLTDGRRNTVITGNGTIETPYVLSFQMDGEYRPPSGELQDGPQPISNSLPTFLDFIDSVSVWESPNTNLFYFAATRAVLTVGNFNVAGTSVTFNTSNTTGVRRVNLVGLDETGQSHYLACDAQHGSASRSTTLSCSAFSAGVLNPDSSILPVFSNTRINGWIVAVYQTSGGLLSISQVKLWMGTL